MAMAMAMETAALPVAASFVATSNAAALEARKVSGQERTVEDIIMSSETFSAACRSECASVQGQRLAPPAGRILQSSASNKVGGLFAANGGLVTGILRAYNSHHELILRADDVWQAVLTQFSFYVQSRAEQLRDAIVDFQGQKELVIHAGGTLFTADFGSIAQRMVDEQIAKNIKDASLAQWLIPNFSTTNSTDRVVASVTVMATMQAYFKYKCCLMCGLPRVTLLGTVEDWRALRIKIDRLPEFDLDDKLMSVWHAMLVPILDHLVKSAEGSPEISFWDNVCSYEFAGSGSSSLSGWVTVFAVFTEEGRWQGGSGADAMAVQSWPRIDTDDIPASAVSVPLLVDDNGTEYHTKLLAGQFAYSVGNAGKAIQPRADWCIALPEAPAPAADRPSAVSSAVNTTRRGWHRCCCLRV